MSCQPMSKLIKFMCMIAIVSHFNLGICISQNNLAELADEEKAPDVNCGKGENLRVSAEDETDNLGRQNLIPHGPSLPFAKTNCSEQSERSSLGNDSAVPLRSLPEDYSKTPVSSPADLHHFWKIGQASVLRRPVEVEESNQTDFQGLEGYIIQRKMSGLPVEADHDLSAWQEMRPHVQCKSNFMTLTVTGRGYLNLLVDTVDALPISLLQLPPHCGYLVKTTEEDLQLMAPYESCYITKQSGRYVLPLQWWGSPVKVSCPVQPSPHPPAFPRTPLTVRCSDFGVTITIPGGNNTMCAPGVNVDGVWAPLVADECAHHIKIQPEDLFLYCPFTAPCLIHQNGAHLHLLIEGLEYLLSCPPLHSVFPFLPHPPLPQPLSPTPVTPGPLPAPPPFPQPLSPYPQPLSSTPATPGPLHAPPSPLTLFSTSVPGRLFAQHVQMLPFHHPDIGTPPPFYPKVPVLYPPPTPFPSTQSSHPTTQFVKPPPAHLVEPHYSQVSCPPNCKYPYHVPVFYPFLLSQDPNKLEPDVPTASTVPQTQGPQTFSTHHTLPTASTVTQTQGPQTFSTHHTLHTASTVTQTQGPQTFSTHHTLPTASTVTQTQGPQTFPSASLPVPPQLSASLQCLEKQMIAKLPYAQWDSIEVKDHKKAWTPISSIPVDCGYEVKREASFGITLVSPLPACHSYALFQQTLTLSLRYLDVRQNKYRILELQCPHSSASASDTRIFPMPAASSTVQPHSSRLTPSKFRLFCSTHHMRVELPHGPISGIVVKDVKGNKMGLMDAPEHCGYSASLRDDGRINLLLPFNSCHMTVQGGKNRIHVVYITTNGRKREARLSCPVSRTAPTQECQVPSEQRLPCGSGALAQGECLALGCCFSSLRPSCYYSMDKCTADRHFVFSVPASFTDPPLSTALLVAAGDDSCTPQRVSRDHAVFKISLEGCGTHRYEVGNTVIYLQEIIHKANLNHGSQTADDLPMRLMVECRYTPGSASVGHLIKSPTVGPSIQTEGVFGVQMRIATDAQYTAYYPQHHRPLQLLLGKPLYLEVRVLNPPDPSVLLLVHYCMAYDLSGRSTWVLLYNGCIVSQQLLSRDHVRRFTIDTFQLLSKSKISYTDEEIYFMCSAQVCSLADGPCVEGCFNQ